MTERSERLDTVGGAGSAGPGLTPTPAPRLPEREIKARIAQAIERARLAMLWESLWPRLMPLLMVALVFLSLSWIGFWTILPDLPRLVLIALFGIAALVSLVPPIRVKLPASPEALSRVE